MSSRFRKCPRCKAVCAVDNRYVDGRFLPHCMNCGDSLRVTKPRGMTLEYVTKEAATDKGMSAKNRLRFHYFNPNGLIHAKHKLDDEISAMVDAGTVKSGWIIAHGTFDSWHEDRVRDLHRQNRPDRIQVLAALSGFADRNNLVRRKIDQVKNAPVSRPEP